MWFNWWPRGSPLALSAWPQCHLAAILSDTNAPWASPMHTACAFIWGQMKRPYCPFHWTKMYSLLFSSLLVSFASERDGGIGAWAHTCVWFKAGRCRQTLPHTHHTSLLTPFLQSKAISELIDVSPSCATRTLLNTDPEPQVTSPNPAH